MAFKIKLSALFMLLFSGIISAQNSDWLPILLNQTSYFSISGSNQILPIKNDQMIPGGSGDFYFTYGQLMQDEFDTCAWAVWNPSPNLFGLPECDFQRFVNRQGSMDVMGVSHEFPIPLETNFGDEVFFVDDHYIRYDTITEETFLGVTDSIKSYTIRHAFMGDVGEIKLSKNHGLIEFVSFRDIEIPNGTIRTFNLVGYQIAGNKVGITAPEITQYLPYIIGDKLVFKHQYWTSINSEFEEITEYHHVTLTNASTSFIEGIAAIYDYQGFLIFTDSSYSIPLQPMLGELSDYMVSIPFISESAMQDLLANTKLIQTQDSGLVGSIIGYDAAYCDSTIVADGFGQDEIYSTNFGLLWKRFGGFGPPSTWRLYAADAANFSYGTWPNWLSVDEHQLMRSSIFPNPTTGTLTIVGDIQMGKVQITDVNGRTILVKSFANEAQLDISTLNKGFYFLKITSENGVGESHRILKVD
jgi:hypothetical protein